MRTRILLPALLLLTLAPGGRALDFKLHEHHVQDLDGGTVDLYFPHESIHHRQIVAVGEAVYG